MILQALTRYYDILAADPASTIAREGYSTEKISFVLQLSIRGKMIALIPLVQKDGNREIPRLMVVPAGVKRTVNVAPNFLWDNGEYIFGMLKPKKEPDDRPERTAQHAKDCFASFKEHHLRLLAGVDSPVAQAMVAFLTTHDPSTIEQNPILLGQMDALKKGGNIVFQLEGCEDFAHEDPAIRTRWGQSQAESDEESSAQCLITGEIAPIARIHKSIKGVRDAQPMGATIVGFNAPAYESYNREQGSNAPVSKRAAFAYTTVLNYLLSSESSTPKIHMGDTTVVYWAESPDPTYASIFYDLFDPTYITLDNPNPAEDQPTTRLLVAIAEKIQKGVPIDLKDAMANLDPRTRFCVLGLAPNASRLSIRFFHQNAFEDIVRRIMAHYEDMEIQPQYAGKQTRITPRMIIEETVSKKSSDKSPSPLMAGALMNAILTNTPYPAALYYAIINRVRADMDDKSKRIEKINYVRASVIKAHLKRKYRAQPDSPIQEVLTMALNEQSRHPAYLLGRLFAVLEKVQAEAIGDVNATIKDRYFTTACASPASVFPVLLRLAQHHVTKAEYGRNSDRRIQDILGLLDMEEHPIPRRLSLDEQGIFILGYYHQRAAFYTPRNNNEEIPQTALENQ